MSKVETNAENIIQSACAHALCVYFDRKGITYRQLWTYSNQQGQSDNQFCADLVGTINSSSLLLIEFKALDHKTGLLPEFKQGQFLVAQSLQAKGIPLIYSYDNEQQLAYYDEPRPKEWPTLVLSAMNASMPDDLDGQEPRRAFHGTLLDWIEGTVEARQTNLLRAFGMAIGGLMPSMARNNIISMLYSKRQNKAMLMDQTGLLKFYEWLLSVKIPNDPLFQGKIDALAESFIAGAKLLPAKRAPDKKKPTGNTKTRP